MKKIAFVLLAVLLCLCVTGASAYTMKKLKSAAAVYEEPSSSSEQIGSLNQGNTVAVEHEGSTWTKIVWAGAYGDAYIKTKHLKSDSGSGSSSSSTSTYYVKVDEASLRESPSSSAGRICYLSMGQKISVYSIENGWAKVRYNGQTAYVKSKCLSRTRSSGWDTTDTTTKKKTTGTTTKDNLTDAFNGFAAANYHAVVTPNAASSYVNLRWGPSTSTKIAGVRYSGDILKVIAQSSTWCQVQDEKTGEVAYMMRRFLVEVPENLVPVADEEEHG